MNSTAKIQDCAPIDMVHLSRQTFGDQKLELEILQLFLVQCRNANTQLSNVVDSEKIATIAHQIKGTAANMGANSLSLAAAALEKSPEDSALRLAMLDELASVESFLCRDLPNR